MIRVALEDRIYFKTFCHNIPAETQLTLRFGWQRRTGTKVS
jgi:hypothetical protein